MFEMIHRISCLKHEHLIVLKVDENYNRRISFKNLLFNTNLTDNIYMVVFEKDNLPSEKKLSDFVSKLKESVNIVNFMEDGNTELLIACGDNSISSPINKFPSKFLHTVEKYTSLHGDFSINGNKVSTIVFQIYLEDNRPICVIGDIGETIKVYTNYFKNQTIFINFNNIDLEGDE